MTLDFLIVVVGVFIGIQVANLNDTRSDRIEEVQYLHALRTDISASQIELTSHLEFLDRQHQAQRQLTEYSAGLAPDLSSDTLNTLMHVGLYELYVLGPQDVTFEELKSSGKLGLIQSAELRSKLHELQAAISVVQQWERDASEIYYRFSDPFLIDYVPVRNVVRNAPSRPGFPSTPWLDPLDGINKLRKDLQTQRFQNIVLYRGNIGAGVRQATQMLEPLYDDIEALISARLIALGEHPE